MASFGHAGSFMDGWIKPWVNKRMPEAFFLDILGMLMDAGRFMVRKNVVHNDIKTANILIGFVPAEDREPGVADHITPLESIWRLKAVVTDFGREL